MALASVLERPMPVNQHGYFGLGGRTDLLDLGPGSPGDGLSLAAPSWGVPEEPRIEMLHGTTTLAFKVLSQPAPRRHPSRSGVGRRFGPLIPTLRGVTTSESRGRGGGPGETAWLGS